MPAKKWTDEALALLLKQHRAGDRICDLARRIDLSDQRIRQLLDQAKKNEIPKVAEPLDGLGVRIKLALYRNDLYTVEDVRAAVLDGRIDTLYEIGKISRAEIRRWLENMPPDD